MQLAESHNSNSDVDIDLIEQWKKLKRKPSVIVFDLDQTLWEFQVKNLKEPITKQETKDGILIVDQQNESYHAFREVPKILKTLKEHCLAKDGHLVVASRSPASHLALKAIDIYGWTQYFSTFQIYPQIKSEHMHEIQKKLNLDSFEDVIFFDDQMKNIIATANLGISSFLVGTNGLDHEAISKALSEFEQRRQEETKQGHLVHLFNHWESLTYKPTLIAFDLDHTLWPFQIRSLKEPLSHRSNICGVEIIDGKNHVYHAYKDVTKILRTLKEHCLGNSGHLAIVSGSNDESLALKAIDLYGWTDYFSSFKIYQNKKCHHLHALTAELGIESFKEVLFFDDKPKNINHTDKLGVFPYLVGPMGLNLAAICEGLTQFDQNQKLNDLIRVAS